MFRPVLAPALVATLLAAPFAAHAQEGATGTVPQRIRSVTITGQEACPRSTDDEIIVCSRINPGEQYRVPRELRDSGGIAASNQSWVNRTAVADRVGRVAGGLPNTCSPVGTGGQSGCSIMWGSNWAAERRAASANDAMVP